MEEEIIEYSSITPKCEIKNTPEYEDSAVSFSTNKTLDVKKKKDNFSCNILKEEKKIKVWATQNGRLSTDGKNVKDSIKPEIEKSILAFADNYTKKYGSNCIVEFAEDQYRVRRVQSELGSSIAVFQDLEYGKTKEKILEFADDDRAIGIPYTIANMGADKYYVINGRVYSGWSMWYGLSSIRSPEDYAKNIDLTYNVSFVWASFNLKAQLSLGASFDIVHGTEESESPEEAFIKEILYSKLNINLQKLTKTAFHLDTYGNAYWHIRRDDNGFPDKITILMPERIKVFLDPMTTKVLYYIYLPPVLAGMALTPYPNVRENPNLIRGPGLTYPTPIILDPQDVLHFKENDYSEFPYGISACKAMIDPCTARMDINMLAPMIFKKYAKPMIHWRLDPMTPFQLTKGQIENYIGGFKSELENMEPMSDPVTSTRWSAMPIGAAQGKAELLTILQDLDNQIFSCTGVPEAYFKPQGMADRMISEQDKTFMAAMQQRQDRVGELIQEKIINPAIRRYDEMINQQLMEVGEEPMPKRLWSQYPSLQWRETFKQDQVTTIQNTLALLQSGIIDNARAARRVGEAPPQESEQLARKMLIDKMTQELQVEQTQLQMMQTQLQEMDTQGVIQAGGTAAVQQMQMEQQAKMDQSGSSGKGATPQGRAEKKNKDLEEDTRYRVTFLNRNGKKQVDVMKGSTLQERKSSGLSISNVEPVSRGSSTEGQQSAGKAIGK